MWLNLLALSPSRLPVQFIFLFKPEKPSRKFQRVRNKYHKASQTYTNKNRISQKRNPHQHHPLEIIGKTMDDSWFIRRIQHDMRIFWRPQLRWIGPWAVALWTQALGDGFRPPALVAAICSGAVIYGRRIISLDNRSHYHLELESLLLLVVIVAGLSFFHGAAAASSCHVVLHLWRGRLHHCHIDCTGRHQCSV